MIMPGTPYLSLSWVTTSLGSERVHSLGEGRARELLHICVWVLGAKDADAAWVIGCMGGNDVARFWCSCLHL